MSSVPKNPLVGFLSHPGPRENNEDTVLCIELPDGRLLVAIADGMGGLRKGELASKAALGALYRHLSEGTGLVFAMLEANSAVYKESKGEDMGTTLVAAVLTGDGVEIANIGDSRAYHFDPLGLVQVTRDHTLGEDAARDGTVTEEEAAATPWGGALSRYLGAEKDVEVDYYGPLTVHEGGWILLCSDGLYRVFSTEDLEAILRHETDPAAAAQRLVEEALERNTQDNVSVALVHRLPGESEDGPARERLARDSAWDPGQFLRRPGRPDIRRTRKGPLTRIFLWVFIPLLVGSAIAIWWWFSTNTN